jgi:hypothetical protein
MAELTFTRIDEPPKEAEPAVSFKKIEPPSFWEGLGTGLLDKGYGALQLGARVPVAPEGAMFAPDMPKYEETVKAVDEKVREREKTLEKEGYNKGWGRTVGNILGDIGITAPLMFTPGGAASLAGRVGTSAALGAAGGGVSGALQPATGGNVGAEKLGQIATGVGLGAALGAPIGAVEHIVAQHMIPIGNRAIQAITGVLNKNAKMGGPSAADAIATVAKANAEGTPLTLLDVGGAPTRALGGSVTRKTPEAAALGEQFMEERAKGSAGRLEGSVSELVHGGPSAFQTDQVLQAAQVANARPLYQQAEALQNIWSPRLQNFLDDPEIQSGLTVGARLERINSLAEGRKFDPTQMGIEFDVDGNVKLLKVPNLRLLDMAKRGLDARIAAERQMDGRLSVLGRELAGLRRAYMKEIDELDTNGVYRAARDAWAGPAGARDAIEFGKSIFRHPEREAAAKEFTEMSPANQEFVRIGVAQELRDRVMRAGVDGRQRRDILNTEYLREQLRPIFRSEEDYDKFIKTVSDENLMRFVYGNVLKGSQTAQRRTIDESGPDLQQATHAFGLAHSTGKGSLSGMIYHGAQLAKERIARPNHALNEEIAKRLFSTAPEMTPKPVEPMSYQWQAAPPVVGGVAGDAATKAMGLR